MRAIVGVVSVAVSRFGYIQEAFTSVGTLEGIILGFAQWLVIKNQIRFSMWWIVANAGAWAVGIFIGYLGTGMLEENFTLRTALVTVATGTAMGTVIGGITGIVFVFLLKSSKKQFR